MCGIISKSQQSVKLDIQRLRFCSEGLEDNKYDANVAVWWISEGESYETQIHVDVLKVIIVQFQCGMNFEWQHDVGWMIM